jgi:hypothetical protein
MKGALISNYPEWVVAGALCLTSGCTTQSGIRFIGRNPDASHLTAVYSKASKDYARAQNPDGTFKPETYVLKNGGNFGGPRPDPTIDDLKFDYMSRVVGEALAAENYLPSDDPDMASLLIMLYWGTTIVPEDLMATGTRPSDMAWDRANANAVTSMGRSNVSASDQMNQEKNRADVATFTEGETGIGGRLDAQSANILGYTDEIMRTSPRDPYLMTLKDEVEHDRYYVVLLAYDYRGGRKFGFHKLLWETRFSIPETGYDFDKAFPAMTAIAEKYFGQDSPGLVHRSLGEGHVDIGEVQTIGPTPDK